MENPYAECAVCGHETLNRIADAVGAVPICSGFCLLAWPRVRALLADRDAWRRQHEKALVCWHRDNETLLEAAHTAQKASERWSDLYHERSILWSALEDQIDAVRRLLEAHGCDCDCEHGAEDHSDTCVMCFPCSVSAVVSRVINKSGGDGARRIPSRATNENLKDSAQS